MHNDRAQDPEGGAAIHKSHPELLPRAYYSNTVEHFLLQDPDSIIGSLSKFSVSPIESPLMHSWLEEITILKDALIGLPGTLFLEFNIPRMGRRIDAVLISGSVILVIEFKVGENHHRREALDQVWDYALDLKNFHEASHMPAILPILVATESSFADSDLPVSHHDLVYPPVRSNRQNLHVIINRALSEITGSPLDGLSWGMAPYRPTPTIIEAAQALYAQHSVDAITRHDAGKHNLRVTSKRVEEIVDETRATGQKVICFVTGVPGAGKTLVGLNIATKRHDPKQPTHAVYLSGNGPLVAVLCEALTRDEVAQKHSNGKRVRKSDVYKRVKAFIQNVHHFRDDALRTTDPPIDRVVIFDEAQRAWNREKTALFMKMKKKRPNFTQSEPEFLIDYLNRHDGWAVIICLVGGGQEINTGEAGIGAWLNAVNENFPDWHVCISPELTDSEYAAGHAIDSIRNRPHVNFDQDLHLAVPMRSFRADNVSTFVKSILDCETHKAREAFSKLRQRYPVALTRDLKRAKQWIQDHARGTERFGLVASSGAQRLKPHAVDVRYNVNPVHWFLNEREDTRSSYYLEDAATEFQVQGLELDWVCATWDGDFRFFEGNWSYHSFCGSAWQSIRKQDRKDYLRNAYRVLLTRARQGMVIFVPQGDPQDPTRNCSYYDPTFGYLESLGIPVL